MGTNPLDMERFFNHRMEEMMRGFFGGVLLPPGMGQPPQMPGQPMPPGMGEQEDDGESGSAGSRDFMLKDGYVKRPSGASGQDEKWEDGEVDINQLDKISPSQQQMPPTQALSAGLMVPLRSKRQLVIVRAMSRPLLSGVCLEKTSARSSPQSRSLMALRRRVNPPPTWMHRR